MSTLGDFEIRVDLEPVRRSAERVSEILNGLRRRPDLSPFEYSTRVRIAPLEIPYSHPAADGGRRNGNADVASIPQPAAAFGPVGAGRSNL
jgi:hypothetical protein